MSGIRTQFEVVSLTALASPSRPLPLGDYRDAFIAEVFGNFRDLIFQVNRFNERLKQRQRAEFPVISSIGDLFLDAAVDWGDAYIRYIINYPIASSRVRRELATNPRFASFVEVSSGFNVYM